MSNYKISIIIPVYNAECYIEELLESIIKQTYTNWELLLVNDGSQDNTVSLINSYLYDTRILLINQENNGPSAARNTGIYKSKGDWLAFIDSDDKISRDYLEKLILHTNSNVVDLVCAGYYEQNRYYPKGIPLHDFFSLIPEQPISNTKFIDNIFNGLTGVLWSKLFRRDVIIKNRLELNTKLKLSEDLVFVLQYVKCIKKIGLIGDYIYYYNRLHDNGLSSKLNLTYLEDVRVFNELILREFDGEDISVIRSELNQKSFFVLLKILKNNQKSWKELKLVYMNISESLNKDKIKCISIENKIFLWLLKISAFNFAFKFNVLLSYFRHLKYEKKNIS